MPWHPIALHNSRATGAVLAVGAGLCCLGVFSFLCYFTFSSHSLEDSQIHTDSGALNLNKQTNKKKIHQQSFKPRYKCVHVCM